MDKKTLVALFAVGMLFVAQIACTDGNGNDLRDGQNASNAIATAVPVIGTMQDTYSQGVDALGKEIQKSVDGSVGAQAGKDLSGK
jgi:hypothetical protein